MQICIFEDINYSNFEPMVFSRPVYDLLCGMDSLKEKIVRSYGKVKISLHCRPYLTEIVQSQNPNCLVNRIEDSECLFINGRVIAPENLAEILPLIPSGDKIFVNEETVVAAYLSGEDLQHKIGHIKDLFSVADLSDLPGKIINIKCANYLWDLINHNGKQIAEDFSYLTGKAANKNFVNEVSTSVHILNKENVFIGANVTIKPGVVLDASGGPIIISDDAYIYPNAVVEGPVFIGKSSRIKSCATIYENVSIGNVCKVGGEVEQSIFMDYSNKQHSGFIGHAYIGSWVNLGADTNNSDLKNNYSKIKIQLSNKVVDTGSQFLGLMIGDHSKSAINTMFNTGTVVGFSCNIFAPGFSEKYVPSFTWGGDKSSTVYDIKKAVETAKIVMGRRKIDFGKKDEAMFDVIFELTKSDREKRGY
jgi:UDP-N-acetylglucosamine diphosphorylase / glucose-1-phosphate thymidylyltransferase / UDP-N-acetylgalactosamine diphosphorylase / glucosamine-1-phosphate N-acetyltransferase / galactosamine-1-phosphate N-acetyltransferase